MHYTNFRTLPPSLCVYGEEGNYISTSFNYIYVTTCFLDMIFYMSMAIFTNIYIKYVNLYETFHYFISSMLLCGSLYKIC